MEEKRNIIITGCSGFIGSRLTEYLSDKYNVIGIDREGEDNVVYSHYTFIKGDINNPKTLNTLRDDLDIYAVIHLAAKAGVRESQSQFEQYVKDNILGTKAILDMCVEHWKPKVFLAASSSSVYGDKICVESVVNDYIKPKSLYAMTKVTMEATIQTYVNNGLLKGCNAKCLRIFTCYGPNQRKGLAIRTFIDNILQDKPITVYGDGTQSRDWTYIDDLCRFIQDIMEYPSSYDNIINAGSSKTHTINDIIYLISKITGKDVTIKYKPMNRYDVMETRSNKTLIGKLTPLEEGLIKQIEWTKKELY